MNDIIVTEMTDEEALLDTLLTSFWYNRTTNYMLSIAKELKGRLDGSFPCNSWSDDADIIYGALVLYFGDYGTSPRSGWINDNSHKILIDKIDDYIKEYKRLYKLEREEQDE